jgi:hypothetical protein
MNGLCPALPDEEGMEFSRVTLVEWGAGPSPHGQMLSVMDKLKTVVYSPQGSQPIPALHDLSYGYGGKIRLKSLTL